MAHPYDAALETYLADQGVPFHVRKTQGTGWAARRHQLEALERWYASGWSRLDTRLRSSITEGVVVFREGEKVVATVEVKGGVATHRLGRLSRGVHAYTASFQPADPAVAAPSTSDTARVWVLF